MNKILFKVALFLAYTIFAGYSSFMTATSVHLKWMSQMPFWLVFIMVFIIALFAGWFLSKAIKELKNSVNPSRVRFLVSLLLFIVFWTFSFMTNVHYNVIQEYGEANLSAQLADCKRYLQANSTGKQDKIEDDKKAAIDYFEKQIYDKKEKLNSEILNEQGGGNLHGFGPVARDILIEIDSIFCKSARRYGDKKDYENIIYQGKKDDAYGRYHDRNYVSKIVAL